MSEKHDNKKEIRTDYNTFLSLHKLFHAFLGWGDAIEKFRKEEGNYIPLEKDSVNIYPEINEYNEDFYIEKDSSVGYSGYSDAFDANSDKYALVTIEGDMPLDDPEFTQRDYEDFVESSESFVCEWGALGEDFISQLGDIANFRFLYFSYDLFCYEPDDAYLLGFSCEFGTYKYGLNIDIQECPFVDENKGISKLADNILVPFGHYTDIVDGKKVWTPRISPWKTIATVPSELSDLLKKVNVMINTQEGKVSRFHMVNGKMVLSTYIGLAPEGYKSIKAFGEDYLGYEYVVDETPDLKVLSKGIVSILDKFPKPVKELYFFTQGTFSKLRVKKCDDGEYIMVVS